ncbi:MAG TPA: TonB-dependent receptor [Steroidobacteraceae bacterium]|nr:TonB-dependent receptor [Steroidobacteraceae bacterium]
MRCRVRSTALLVAALGPLSCVHAEVPRLEEIVVTAQKREERLSQVPMSVAVLDGARIDASTLTGVTEALNTVPGVAANVGYQGGATLISVRGIGASGPLLEGSSPIAYYLDAMPFGLVTSAVAPDSGAYDLQRIEVLRGPQGTLYGANAQNGVVRVLTRDADLDGFGLSARVTGSDTNDGGGNYRGDLAINVPVIESKLALRGVVGYSKLSGWVDGPVGENVNDSELRTYRLKVNAQPTDALAIALSAWSSRDDYGAPSASDDDAHISATQAQPIAIDYDVYSVKVGYEAGHFSVASMTSVLDYSNRSLWDLLAGGLPGVNFSTGLDSHVLSEELIFHSRPDSEWRWTAGASYRHGQDRLLQSSVILPAPLDYTFRSESFAAFGETGRRFADNRFEWVLGLRYFHDDVLNRENTQSLGLPGVPLYHATDTFDSTTPRAVLTWHASDDLTTYASYAEGFRSGFPQNAGVIAVEPDFPPLRPDKLHNYEVGAKGNLGERVSFDTALYYIRWNDVQQSLAVFFQGVPLVANVNSKPASGVGVDLGLHFRPVDRLDLGIHGSWNNLSFDEAVPVPGGVLFEKGDRLNYSPELTARALGEYEFALGGGGLRGVLAASADYTSKQEHRGSNTGTAVVSGDALFIARASFAIRSGDRWTAMLFADNLTNEDGATPTVTLVPEWMLRVRPRTVGVQLSFGF